MIIACPKCKVQLRVNTAQLNVNSPLIRCSKCKTVIKVALPKTPSIQQPIDDDETVVIKKEEAVELGWIVVHDEWAVRKTYPLVLGKNVMGRKSPTKPCDVMIEFPPNRVDKTMGRNHCTIEIVKRPNGTYNYILSDLQSKNGTFLNETKNNRLHLGEEIYLQDGDTIQMGQTKVVLKTIKVTPNKEVASNTVLHSPISKTVVMKYS